MNQRTRARSPGWVASPRESLSGPIRSPPGGLSGPRTRHLPQRPPPVQEQGAGVGVERTPASWRSKTRASRSRGRRPPACFCHRGSPAEARFVHSGIDLPRRGRPAKPCRREADDVEAKSPGVDAVAAVSTHGGGGTTRPRRLPRSGLPGLPQTRGRPDPGRMVRATGADPAASAHTNRTNAAAEPAQGAARPRPRHRPPPAAPHGWRCSPGWDGLGC